MTWRRSTLLLDSAFKQERLDGGDDCARRIRALKPLDPAIREREAVIRIGLARRCALAGRWEEGRDQFRAAAELSPEIARRTILPRPQGLFEAKAGQARRERPVLEGGPGGSAGACAALAGPRHRVEPLSNECGHDERLCRALDFRAQEKMPEPDGRRDGGVCSLLILTARRRLSGPCQPGRSSSWPI